MKQNGLTLIELIMTLLIISILGAYAWPNYRNLKLNQDMTQAINRLSSSLQFARNQSIIMGQQVVICPSQSFSQCDHSTEWHRGWMVFNDPNHDRQLNPGESVLLVEQKLSPQLAARSTGGRRLVRYDRTGFSPGTNLSIRFCDERGVSDGKAIVVNNAGRVRVSQNISNC